MMKIRDFVFQVAALLLSFGLCSHGFGAFVKADEAPCQYLKIVKEGDYCLRLMYAGECLAEINHDAGKGLYVPPLSDGVRQSGPLRQVVTLAFLEEGAHNLDVRLHLGRESGVMRSRRARGGEAILGQSGHPLIYGVAGVYDAGRDFLLEWDGGEWNWKDRRMMPGMGEGLDASFAARVTNAYFSFVFRPHYYGEHLGYRHYKPWQFRPRQESINGWCSWKAYGQDFSPENLKRSADFLKKNFLPYGLQYLQVDNGYQVTGHAVSGLGLARYWTNVWNGFGGSGQIAQKIKEYGLKPGIWVSPDIPAANVISGGEDLLLKDFDGKAVGRGWLANPLDMSDFVITNHFVPLFKGLRKAGFEYVKIDAIRHTLLDSLLMGLGTDEARRRFRNLSLAARLCLKDDIFLLGSWGIIPELTGAFDGCRIAEDCDESWASAHNQLYSLAEFFPLQRVLFLNDPDYVVMKGNLDWAKSRLSAISLSGGLLMFSDRPEDMDAERTYALQRALPALETRSAESGQLEFFHQAAYVYGAEYSSPNLDEKAAVRQAGPSVEKGVASPFSTLWAFHVSRPFDNWCIVKRTALWPLQKDVAELEKLGLEPGRTYLAYDFWQRKYLGEVSGRIEFEPLKFGHTQVVALREKLERPQFLASTRHISMGGVEISGCEWLETENALKLRLVCVAGTTEDFVFHIPKAWELKEAAAEGGTVRADKQGEILKVSIAASEKDVELNLRF